MGRNAPARRKGLANEIDGKLDRELQRELDVIKAREAEVSKELQAAVEELTGQFAGGRRLGPESMQLNLKRRLALQEEQTRLEGNRRFLEDSRSGDPIDRLHAVTAVRRERSVFHRLDEAFAEAVHRARLDYQPLEIRLVMVKTSSQSAIKFGFVEVSRTSAEAHINDGDPSRSFLRADGGPLPREELFRFRVTIPNRLTGAVDRVLITSHAELDLALRSRGWTETGKPAVVAGSSSLGHRVSAPLRSGLKGLGIDPEGAGYNVYVRPSDGGALTVTLVMDPRMGTIPDFTTFVAPLEPYLAGKLGRKVHVQVWGIHEKGVRADPGEIVPLAVNQ
jgi:hypothetical protein